MVDIKEIEAFFFEAMLKGYLSKAGIEEGDYFGQKSAKYEKGDFFLQDTWLEIPGSTWSAGTTIIWHRNFPVWFMQYHGQYNPEAIPTLKKALAFNYEKNLFFGGRGPLTFIDGNLCYSNFLDDEYLFGKFSGREQIVVLEWNEQLGFHEYHGGIIGKIA